MPKSSGTCFDSSFLIVEDWVFTVCYCCLAAVVIIIVAVVVELPLPLSLLFKPGHKYMMNSSPQVPTPLALSFLPSPPKKSNNHNGFHIYCSYIQIYSDSLFRSFTLDCKCVCFALLVLRYPVSTMVL